MTNLVLSLDDERLAVTPMRSRRNRVHGTRRGYQRGCRCAKCRTDGREDNNRYMRDYRAGERGKRSSRKAWP